jgi:hypothetical protein
MFKSSKLENRVRLPDSAQTKNNFCMRNVLVVLAFLLAFVFVAASVYIIVTQPENKDAWGWLMALGFFTGMGATNSIK